MSLTCHNGYCHVTPGRVRVRVTGLKNNHEAAKSLQVLMASQPGVKHVRANHVTANVLITFDSNMVRSHDVLDGLADLGHYPMSSPDTYPLRPETENQLSELGMRIAKIALKQALSGTPVALLFELL